jgi:hypothetical protein
LKFWSWLIVPLACRRGSETEYRSMFAKIDIIAGEQAATG